LTQKPEEINPPPLVSEEKISMLENMLEKSGQTQENLQNQITGLSSAIMEIQGNVAALTQQINNPVKPKNAEETPIKEKTAADHKASKMKKTFKWPNTRN
jgi:predicted  nucleic acid-binding Zn-ribbon protein